MMDLFLVVVCLMLVLANVWIHGIASEAKDEVHTLYMRLEGQKQQLIQQGYRLHSLEKQLEKKGKKHA
jgi:hypothetical protein